MPRSPVLVPAALSHTSLSATTLHVAIKRKSSARPRYFSAEWVDVEKDVDMDPGGVLQFSYPANLRMGGIGSVPSGGRMSMIGSPDEYLILRLRERTSGPKRLDGSDTMSSFYD